MLYVFLNNVTLEFREYSFKMFSLVNLKQKEKVPSPLPPVPSPSKETLLRKSSHVCELSLSLLIAADLLRISPILFLTKAEPVCGLYRRRNANATKYKPKLTMSLSY